MSAGFDLLASGFGLVEGPTYAPDGSLYFSDVLGGGVVRLAPAGSVETVIPKRRGVGGIALHADGGLVVGGRDIVHVKGGVTRTLFSLPGLPGWNDLCTDSLGRVYAGSVRFFVFEAGATPVPGECFRIDAEGSASELYRDVLHANGIALSPDEQRIVHSDSRRRCLWLHDLDAEGRAVNRRSIAVDGQPDGLAFDSSGCVWLALAGEGRVDRFRPDGRRDFSLEVPARVVTSLCFGGSDGRDLFVVTADNTREPERRGCVFRTRADVAGAPVHPARI